MLCALCAAKILYGGSMKEKLFTIPNILSVFRIILIPFVVWSYTLGRRGFMLILIALSAFTDVIDGIIARKFNMVTAVGKALDPIADKLTLLALLLTMCDYLDSPPIFVLSVIFVVKEIIMGIEGIAIIKATGTTYSANAVGKATTVALYINIFIHIAWKGIPRGISALMIGISIAFVCASLVVYTKQNLRIIKEHKKIPSGKNE